MNLVRSEGEKGWNPARRGQRDSVHVGRDPPPSGFYFTNYFICLELFQLDLGPVSKRANTAALAVVASLGAAPLFVHHQRQRSTTDATATL